MWPALIPVLGSVLDKIFPDKQAADAAKFKLFELAQAGELKALDADLEAMRSQTDINKIEAAHDNVFVSGWRPAVGWICALALAYQYIGRPLLIGLAGYTDMPGLDGTLWELLAGLLGIAGFRTFEKVRGVTGVATGAR